MDNGYLYTEYTGKSVLSLIYIIKKLIIWYDNNKPNTNLMVSLIDGCFILHL